MSRLLKMAESISLLLVLAFGLMPAEDVYAKGAAVDWPRWRGANFDGTASKTGVFKFDQGFGLSIAWREPLGSGYSSVSIAEAQLPCIQTARLTM